MSYQLAIFDFDGTLADSMAVFVEVFNELAQVYRYRPVVAEEIPELRRHGARELIKHFGISRWRVPLLAYRFRAEMKRRLNAIALFDGIAELLRELSARGVRLAIVSANRHDTIRQVLGPDIASLISHFECGTSIFSKTAKLRTTLKVCRAEAAGAIYIGDQITDLESARRARIACGAVAWGYGELESLKACAPDMVFDRVDELLRLAPA
ncbi:HAD hydrolase-like protein [Chitinimonas lacunae]|uniref:HAD hydrolase-like protein n=1 Tax=Chitinimonas lacunae TaxID=1963018 RepID=A0ABV8MVK5_9NEIS